MRSLFLADKAKGEDDKVRRRMRRFGCPLYLSASRTSEEKDMSVFEVGEGSSDVTVISGIGMSESGTSGISPLGVGEGL